MTPLCRGRRREGEGGVYHARACVRERARESEWAAARVRWDLVGSLSAVSQLLFIDLLDFYWMKLFSGASSSGE